VSTLDAAELTVLESIQRRVLWLATWMVHHANFERPNPDGVKVGGHQASSASVVTLLTALYFRHLRPTDVVAVKAHGAPAFYACHYLRGTLDRDLLRRLREFGGLQAYPSRRKNRPIVDLSTGSMGLGAVSATFGAWTTRYLADHFGTTQPGRFVVMVGDAELDEGNVWEALQEEPVGRLGSVLWLVDLNRQSLDRVTPDARRLHIRGMFATAGWRLIELRWGSRLRQYPDLVRRLEAMGHAEYQSLLCLPPDRVQELVGAPKSLVADVGGHDLTAVLDALEVADRDGERPTVIVADTIKGWGLPFAGDPLNHGMLLTAAQLEELRRSLGVDAADPLARFPAESPEGRLIAALPPLFRAPRPERRPRLEVPDTLDTVYTGTTSTQEALGRVLGTLARLPIAERIVTVSADVAVTTHLAGWINRRGVYALEKRPDVFTERGIAQAVQWRESPGGQHVELGIAEHNLFLLLTALGLADDLSGEPLLALGTLYDPFVARGLDALLHALYSGARFVVVATPSGVTLSPEGGAHQSVVTPSVGIALPHCTYYEPPFAHDTEWILLEGLRRIAGGGGESFYLRLSTRPIDQSLRPTATARDDVLAGAYRLVDCSRPDVTIWAAGVMAPEAVAASRRLAEDGIAASVFAITSPDLLFRGYVAARRQGEASAYLDDLVRDAERTAPVVTVLDGHPHALAFLGSALGVLQAPLGVDDFGQSGSRGDLYRHYGIDEAAIVRAARGLLD
jgi:pyruvate dehydrogenase E1 component